MALCLRRRAGGRSHQIGCDLLTVFLAGCRKSFPVDRLCFPGSFIYCRVGAKSRAFAGAGIPEEGLHLLLGFLGSGGRRRFFVEDLVKRANDNRRKNFLDDLAHLNRLPDERLDTDDIIKGVRVSRSSTINVGSLDPLLP